MVSNAKRMKYVSDDATSSEEISYSDDDYQPDNKQQRTRRPTREPKVFSRNALMARENRLKKKMYITNLESEVSSLKNKNKKLNSIVNNQTNLISQLETEVKYLKSVLKNSGDISRLIRNIHKSTGMSVTTSLDENLSNVFVQKRNVPIARKTSHPWEETNQFSTLPTPELSCNDDFESNDILNDIDLNSFNRGFDIKSDDIFEEFLQENNIENKSTFEEHNYTVPIEESDDDVGVCLHVSKHRVSLEFCSSCSDNAQNSWSSN